jgi:hypothetical protein
MQRRYDDAVLSKEIWRREATSVEYETFLVAMLMM